MKVSTLILLALVGLAWALANVFAHANCFEDTTHGVMPFLILVLLPLLSIGVGYLAGLQRGTT